MSSDEDDPVSPGSDIEGWRRVIAQDALSSLRIEDIVAGLQDIGPNADRRVVNALMMHIADKLTRFLRRRVGYNHPNNGQDIIDRAHAEIIAAVLQPKSADGKGLRESFYGRAKFRLADAFQKELKHARQEASTDAGILDEAPPDDFGPDDGDLNEAVFVEELLSHLPDWRMALALRLDIDGCPIESKKGTHSIAGALGVSSKTAGELLAEAKRLVRLRIGERA